MFVYGIQYLRGFTPERDQWESDMKRMKELGFNTIRAWLVWNCIERKEGEYDLSYVAEFLSLAERYGLQVGLLFHFHACPAWAIRKYPHCFYVDEKNQPFEPAVRSNTPSGGWPGLCYDHAEVRELERRFITAVMQETRTHKNVAFYEPMNEPHVWIDHTQSPAGIFCYCEETCKKFRAWLQRKYGDVEALNKAWGQFYGDFEEIRPPRWGVSYGDYADFRQFEAENLVEEITFRSELIRSLDNKPVIAHSWGGGCVTCPQLGGMAFDDWKNARVFDQWGFSAFPVKAEQCALLGLGGDAARSAANGKEFWQAELSAGICGDLFHTLGRADGDTFDKFTLESLRHGASGLLYWQYRRERIGAELGGFAMADYDGGPTPLTEKAAALGKFLAAHGERLKTAKNQRAEVALVFSLRSYYAGWLANGKKDNQAEVDALAGYYRILWEENIPVDILHEEFAEELERYKLVILPSPAAIHPDLVPKLEQYVKNGGMLLSEQLFGVFDPDFKLSYGVPGYGFDAVFGGKQDDYRRVIDAETAGTHSLRIEGRSRGENYRCTTAEAVSLYGDGTPAILRNPWGKGVAYLSGLRLGDTYSGGELLADDLTAEKRERVSYGGKAFVMKLCRESGVEGNCCSAKDVKVTLLQEGDEGLVILINSAAEGRQGTVALKKSYRSAEAVYREAPLSLCGENLWFELEPNASAVIYLK